MNGRLDPALQHASHLPKPQLKFKRKVDNTDMPWRPTLKHKYNAQVPLGYDMLSDDEGDTGVGNGNRSCATHPSVSVSRLIACVDRLHPYHHEIRHISYPSHMFRYAEPISPKPFEDTPFKWIASPAELAELLDSLRSAQEIAVDLEYHSYRSYHGFVCLMQISTRSGDWIVDTLAVRDELEQLNEVFTDPRIVKVSAKVLLRFGCTLTIDTGLSWSRKRHRLVTTGL